MKSLRSKLIMVVSFFTAICMIVMACVGYVFSAEELRKTAVENYKLSTKSTTNEINTWLSTETELVESQTMSLEIMNNFDNSYLADYLTPIVNDYNENGYIYDLFLLRIRTRWLRVQDIFRMKVLILQNVTGILGQWVLMKYFTLNHIRIQIPERL